MACGSEGQRSQIWTKTIISSRVWKKRDARKHLAELQMERVSQLYGSFFHGCVKFVSGFVAGKTSQSEG